MDKKGKASKFLTRTGINPKMIQEAFTELSRCKANFTSAVMVTMQNQAALEKAEAEALLAGRNTGKNPDERKAWSRVNFGAHHDLILTNELDEKRCRMELDEAEVQAEKVKALLRLEEVTSQDELTAFNMALVERSDGWPEHVNEGKG